VVSGRGGRLSLGCLFSLLLLTVALYFGVNIGEVYWRYYRYQDAMEQEVRFAHLHSDQAIARRLALVAESLGLPDGARQLSIQRDDGRRHITLGASYAERVELPGFVRTLEFAPRAEGTY
jgi:hypothetical protein